MKYSHVFWDWNGTLLDDADWCLDVINTMLAKRQLPLLADLNAYREVFGFPVADYYRRVGLDFARESFESLAEEYMGLYHREQTGGCSLHAGAEDLLGKIRASGSVQLIFTASQTQKLLAQMAPFSLEGYFDDLLSVGDIYARSKLDIGRAYMDSHRVERGLMIGDSLHDYEVAHALGLDCLLVCQGHHSREALAACGAPVLGDLGEVEGFIFA